MLDVTWKDLLARTDLVGGDLLKMEGDGRVFRGPITEILKTKSCIYVRIEWGAELTKNGWVLSRKGEQLCVRQNDYVLAGFEDGRISLSCPFMVGVIYPKGGDKLDAKEVKGLEQE